MGIDRLRDDDAPLVAGGTGVVGRTDLRETTPDAGADGAPGRQSADAPGGCARGERIAARAGYQAKAEAVYLDAARQHWHATARAAFQEEWADYTREHPTAPAEAAAIDQAAAGPVRRGCAQIRETEETVVTPAMLRIEAADPDRRLVGLEFRRKGETRIMEKAATALQEQPSLAPEEALASVKDAIRYTFQYTEEHYTDGVYADVDRLKAAGFELVELRNSWRCEEYKGINSRWQVHGGGQLFEVQFHTQISFEAKQLTHSAYGRIRHPATPDAEVPGLREFQRKVNAVVPNPSGATDIPTYP